MFGALRAQLPPLILALSLMSLSAAAQDEVSSTDSPSAASDLAQGAATQFDVGVQAYKQADYTRAAEAFLAADNLLPSASALSNALMAARRAGLPLLIARAAERALSRANTSEPERRSAENALAEQSPKLSRLEVSCVGECQVQVEGVALATQGSYVLPGEHRVGARGFVEQVARCEAALPCRVELRPLPSVPTASETALQSAEPAPVSTPTGSEPPAPPAAPATETRRKKGRLPLGVFASSGVGALVLLSLATWKGVAALEAEENYKENFKENPDAEWNATELARTSDFLLAGGVVLAGAAIASAIWWVDWGAYGETKLAVSGQGGATLTLRRRF
jgi:hypothetical protein